MNSVYLGKMNQNHLKRNNMYEESNCCGADRWYYTDLCSDCKEHAEFIEVN
jgi:hypothetical protein